MRYESPMLSYESPAKGRDYISNRNKRKVISLLNNIHRIAERQYLKGDYSATVELIDLERAINKAELTEKQRTALLLVYVEDMGQAEAARKMGVSQQAVSTYISNAVRKVAREL